MDENAPMPIVAVTPQRVLNVVLWPTPPKQSGVAPIDSPLGLKVPGVLRQALTFVADGIEAMPQQVALLGESSQVSQWLLTAHEKAVSDAFAKTGASLSEAITPASQPEEETEETTDYSQQAIDMLASAKLSGETVLYENEAGTTIATTIQCTFPVREGEWEAAHKFARIFARKYQQQFGAVNVVWAYRPAALTDRQVLQVFTEQAQSLPVEVVGPDMPEVYGPTFGPRNKAEALNLTEDLGESTMFLQYAATTT